MSREEEELAEMRRHSYARFFWCFLLISHRINTSYISKEYSYIHITLESQESPTEASIWTYLSSPNSSPSLHSAPKQPPAPKNTDSSSYYAQTDCTHSPKQRSLLTNHPSHRYWAPSCRCEPYCIFWYFLASWSQLPHPAWLQRSIAICAGSRSSSTLCPTASPSSLSWSPWCEPECRCPHASYSIHSNHEQ